MEIRCLSQSGYTYPASVFDVSGEIAGVFVGQFPTFDSHKSKKGSLVMTPRTTLRLDTAR